MKTRFLSAALAAMLFPAAAMAQVAVGDATPTVGTTVFPAQDGTQTGILVSSQVRANDPSILDAKFIVYGEAGETVKVRALAFEDGERSFLKVVRPETFVADSDGNPTEQNIGDVIPCNAELNLSWKVSSDWDTDLAHAKFEILVIKDLPLPLDLVNIPAVDEQHPALSFSQNGQYLDDVFNALLWCYADKADDLSLYKGYLKTRDILLAYGSDVGGTYDLAIRYLYERMGYALLAGVLKGYAFESTRRGLIGGDWPDICPSAVDPSYLPESLFVGDDAYLVVDISAGTNAVSYPVSYLDSAPMNGWDDEFKKTKLLLRKIPAGVFKTYSMEAEDYREVTLTHGFYMGVFEVTQQQWELVMGTNPAIYKGSERPIENVSWNDIRGDSDIYDWPTETNIDPASFMGRISSKTNLDFDLPTEAQWIYSCLAGTTFGETGLLSARTDATKSDGLGGYTDAHTSVGSYFANSWGLYDMCGNVREWALDWCGSWPSDAVDPKGGSSSFARVACGGCWSDYSGSSNSSRNLSTCEDFVPSFKQDTLGFRLCRTIP